MVDREQVVEAALAVAQQHGLPAMTMRAVAEALQVTPMTIYRHLPDKDALLDALVGRLLSEIETPADTLPWQQRLGSIALQLYDAAERYPTVAPMLLTRPYLAPAAVTVVEAMYRLLADADVPLPEIPRIERLISTALLGYAVSAANQAFWAHDPAGPGEVSTIAAESGKESARPPARRWRDELEANLAEMVLMITARGAPA